MIGAQAQHRSCGSSRSIYEMAVGERSIRTEVTARAVVECMEVIMPARVAIIPMRTRDAESLRFPGEGQSSQGQADPKARPKGVVDGKQANIPAPLHRSEGGTQKERAARRWSSAFKGVGGGRGKSLPAFNSET